MIDSYFFMFFILFSFSFGADAFEFPTEMTKVTGPGYSWTTFNRKILQNLNGKQFGKYHAVICIDLPSIILNSFDESLDKPYNTAQLISDFAQPYINNVTFDEMKSASSKFEIEIPDIGTQLTKNLESALYTKSLSSKTTYFNVGIGTGFYLIIILVVAIILLVFYLVQCFACCCCCKPQENTKPGICICIAFHIGTVLLVISIVFAAFSIPSVLDASNKLLNSKQAYCKLYDGLFAAAFNTAGSMTEHMLPIPEALDKTGVNVYNAFKELLQQLDLDTEAVQHLIQDEGNLQQNIFALFLNENSEIYKKIKEINEKIPEEDKKINLKPDVEKIQREAVDALGKAKDGLVPFRSSMKEFKDFLQQTSGNLSKQINFKDNYQSQLDSLRKKSNYSDLANSDPEMNSNLEKLSGYSKDVNLYSIIIIVCLITFAIFACIIYSAMLTRHSKCSRCCASSGEVFPLIFLIILLILSLVFTLIGVISLYITFDFDNTVSSLGTGVRGLFEDGSIVIPDLHILLRVSDFYLNLTFYGYKFTFPTDFDPIGNILHSSDQKGGIGTSIELSKFLDLDNFVSYIGRFADESNNQFKHQLQLILTQQIEPNAAKYFPENGLVIDSFSITEKIEEMEKNATGNDQALQLIGQLKVMLTEPSYSKGGRYLPVYAEFRKNVSLTLTDAYTTNFLDADGKYNRNMNEKMNYSFTSIQSALLTLGSNLVNIFDNIQNGYINGPAYFILDLVGHDMGYVGNFICYSCLFSMLGYVFYSVNILIRRKGMFTLDELRDYNNKKMGFDGEDPPQDDSASSDFSDSVFYMGGRTGKEDKKKKKEEDTQENLSTFWLH